MIFANRCEAGRRLAALLAPYRVREPLVLGLPRGGVPVAYEIAHALGAPLDVLAVRKLGAPGQPELAIGALAPGVAVLDDALIALLGVAPAYLAEVRAREAAALAALDARLRGDRPPPDLRARTVVLVDDGIATGATMLAAVDCAHARGAGVAIVAAPVCAREAARKLRDHAEGLVCLDTPADFGAVGYWYADFTPTSDDEVRRLLKRADLEQQARFRPPARS